MTSHSLLNGEPAAKLGCENRALAYGDGLFETILVEQGRPQLLGLHLQRLRHGCQRLRLELDFDVLARELQQMLLQAAREQTWVLKVTVFRGPCGRGYRPVVGAGCQRLLQLDILSPDYQRLLDELRERGAILRHCTTPASINPSLAGMKHLSRLENVLARAEWQDDKIFEGLMYDPQGQLIEGTMSNVFLFRGTHLLTPALDSAGVAGVVRQLIVDRAGEALGFDVQCVSLSRDDLDCCDELFICNSVAGALPVAAIAGRSYSLGANTRRLQRWLQTVMLEDESV